MELLPGPLFSGAKAPGDFRRYASLYLGTYFHPVGTCRLGSDIDGSAVVGPRLSVRGVRGLRVADASVIPVIMGAGTVGACLMIGQRCVEMILEDAAKSSSGGGSSTRRSGEKGGVAPAINGNKAEQ